MGFAWPQGFSRVPLQKWRRRPLEELAQKYDTVEQHGWYANLDRTVEQVERFLRDGNLLIDYSGGTGIFAGRLLRQLGDRAVGIVIVDASKKFLRLALEKFRDDERIAFRLIRYLKKEHRLQLLEEVLAEAMRADAIVSTNAIHLYYDLEETLQSWGRVLRPGGRAFVQSGNIQNPDAPAGEWIIDETVESIHRVAVELVRKEERYARYRVIPDDASRMAKYTVLREKYFLPVRPLQTYVTALEGAGLSVEEVSRATIEARVDEWYEFLSAYHEGALGWVGGAEKIEGRPPTEEAVRDRLAIMRRAMDQLFEGREVFPCCWTYITCRQDAEDAKRSAKQK